LSGLPKFALNAEREDEFAVSALGLALVFTRNSAGAVTNLLINNEGSELRATKMP
jgi:hypothetical protein